MSSYIKTVTKWVSIQVVIGIVICFLHFMYLVWYAIRWNETIVRSWLTLSRHRFIDVCQMCLYLFGVVILATILLVGWHLILNKDNKWWKDFLAFVALIVAAVIDCYFITPYGLNYLGILLFASICGIFSQGVWVLFTWIKKRISIR